MANKPFLQSVWYGGETNDKYLGVKQGQVSEMVSMDISKSKYIKSANGYIPQIISDYTSSSKIKQIITAPGDSTKTLRFFENGEVYSFFGLATSLSGKTIVNAGVIGNKGFIISTDGSIGTWNYNVGANDLGIGDGISYFNLLTGADLNFAPFMIDIDFLYIGTQSKMYIIDTSDTTWALDDTIDFGSGVIRGLTRIGDQINIYINLGSSSRQYIYGGAEAAKRYIDWYDRSILNVANMNNIDYVVCEDGLYVASGYQPDILYSRYFNSDYTNAIETYQNKIYIPGYNCIYAYESLKPGFPYQLTSEVVILNDRTSEITCLKVMPRIFSQTLRKFTADILIGHRSSALENENKVYISQYASGRRLQTSNPMGGYVKLNPIPSIYGNKKAAKKIRLGYYLSETGTTTKDYIFNGVTKTFAFKNSIGVFQYTGGRKVNIYVGGVDNVAVGDVYRFDNIDCEVISIDNLFEEGGKKHGWLELEIPETANIELLKSIIGRGQRLSGTGDSFIYHLTIHKGELVFLYLDNENNGKSQVIPSNFNEIEFTIHQTDGNMNGIENNERLLTKIYDFGFVYEDIEIDLN